MIYDAELIANRFIELAEKQGRCITAMQLQKLLYFAHGWHLAFTGDPLFRQRIEAWQYGPVVNDVYQAFKHLGADDLRGHRAMRQEGCFHPGTYVFECVDSAQTHEIEPDVDNLILQVDKVYGPLSASQLSGVTHVDGSPWTISYKTSRDHVVFNDELIKGYFEKCASDNRSY